MSDASIPTPETIANWKAQHGALFALQAGDYSAIVRKLTSDEWGDVAEMLDAKDPGALEFTLKLARLSPDADGLGKMLSDCPQLGDLWGAQVLELHGWNAKVREEKEGGRLVLVVGAKRVPVRKMTQAEWMEGRQITVRKGQRALFEHLFAKCCALPEADRVALARELPALPEVLGAHIASLGAPSSVEAPRPL